jgi:hypothetical protein
MAFMSSVRLTMGRSERVKEVLRNISSYVAHGNLIFLLSHLNLIHANLGGVAQIAETEQRHTCIE